ncbi:MAG: helix-turn-helix transcriptional regulator [Tessaracoccus sp.]|uniref:helix-turn-helix domain-containing protein n=1 Tax=Tessaracoccus sp. TaxID=1971211 RepID=UPI001EC253F3|nr:helix-turn-helix transcriptional regulator [Tessaracoccus sp.]MBK7822861.1 helix-turn-helix transcriptional regulator [Tessaracoccus sp.]
MKQSTQALVAQAVRVQRVRAGISSDAELARRADMDPSALNRRLNGTLRMDLDDIETIAQALGVDPFDLLSMAQAERAAAA